MHIFFLFFTILGLNLCNYSAADEVIPKTAPIDIVRQQEVPFKKSDVSYKRKKGQINAERVDTSNKYRPKTYRKLTGGIMVGIGCVSFVGGLYFCLQTLVNAASISGFMGALFFSPLLLVPPLFLCVKGFKYLEEKKY